MRLFKTAIREIPENMKSVLWVNTITALSTTAFIGIVPAATREAAGGRVSLRMLLLFAIVVVVLHFTQIYTLVTASRDTERLIHKLRIRIFDLVRRSDLVTIDRIGRANLQSVLTQEMQVLAEVLPMIVVGSQHAIILVFLAIYLAWLSPIACLLAFGLAGLTVVVRLKRTNELRTFMQSSAAAEGRIFDGLTELLDGFKEVRMDGPRAEELTDALAESSLAARQANATLKARWGWNYALIESMLYSLAGLMVFVVPLFAAGFYEVAMQATFAVLFISGPVSTVSFVTPLAAQAEMALETIETMQDQLRAAANAADAEATGALEGPPSSIALRDANLAYRDSEGASLFTVGPARAEFHAGQVTFITGGNGSGKSSLLRMLTGLIPLDSGAILADGRPVEKEQMQDYRDRISAIFSDFHLSRRLYSLDDPDQAATENLLERFEMLDKVQLRNGAFTSTDLSSGQRKRLALIVAELEDKPVIVLDEWAADQDPHFRRFFYEEILPDLKTRGKIIICVTHDDRWFHLADRVYRMFEGRIEEMNGKETV
jgi:putative ATP-binding cassette transporter